MVDMLDTAELKKLVITGLNWAMLAGTCWGRGGGGRGGGGGGGRVKQKQLSAAGKIETSTACGLQL